MFGLKNYLGLGMVLAIFLAIWGAYFYYKNTQATIAQLTEENTRLEIALEQEIEKARKLAEFQKAQALLIKEANDAFNAAEQVATDVVDFFSKIDLNTAEGQIQMNTAFNDLLKAIECDTGNCK